MSGTKEDVIAEKEALANHLRGATGLGLSPAKTKITAMTEGFEFLGFGNTLLLDYPLCCLVACSQEAISCSDPTALCRSLHCAISDVMPAIDPVEGS